jgi:hypothetical protein
MSSAGSHLIISSAHMHMSGGMVSASFRDAARWVSPQVFAHCKVLEICEMPKAARTDN